MRHKLTLLSLLKKPFFYLALLTLHGCANFPGPQLGEEPPNQGLNPSASAYPRSRFPDLPIPDKFKFDRDKSFIYESGSGAVKVGRLFFRGWSDLDNIVTFYQNEMLNNGWQLVRVMEDNNTLLLYEKEGWVCTVVISSLIGQSSIEIQIGPK